MITTVNCGLSLQLTRLLVNYQQSTTNYANDTNSLVIRIRAIREIRSSYHKVQSSNLKVQRILWIRGIRVIRSPNLFYIS